MLDAEERKERAKAYFLDGYNCSQSLILAFADIAGLDANTAAKLGLAFGGGMGRLREVCGAVSGMFAVIGLIYGKETPDDENKREVYAKVQTLAERFKVENGSIICRELLGLAQKSDSPTPEKRTGEYYKKRPCAELVKSAAGILTRFINEENI